MPKIEFNFERTATASDIINKMMSEVDNIKLYKKAGINKMREFVGTTLSVGNMKRKFVIALNNTDGLLNYS